MFGLIVFGLLGIYLLLLAWATRRGWRWGVEKKGWTGRKRYLGAAIGFLIVYIPVFWDWLPTVAVHQFYCAKDSGFWVYKTLDQWKAENPGVMEGLVTQQIPQNKVERGNGYSISTTYWNARINSTLKRQEKIFPNLWRREDEILDTQTGEVLARYVGFSTSQEQRQAGWSGWKFWLDSENCIDGQEKAISFVKFVNQFKGAKK